MQTDLRLKTIFFSLAIDILTKEAGPLNARLLFLVTFNTNCPTIEWVIGDI